MSYQPVQPIKTLMIAQIIPYEDIGILQYSALPERALDQIPRNLRTSILAALMIGSFIANAESPEEAVARLDYPEDVQFDVKSLTSSQVIEQFASTIKYLSQAWPFEFSRASLAINDLESALMCLCRKPGGPLMSAFCPDGSRGFARYVHLQGINNPRALPIPKPARRKSFLEQVLGMSMENIQILGLGDGRPTDSAEQKDIEFPE